MGLKLFSMKVLVPLDFSEVSLRALRVARLIEGQRTILHVVPVPDARPQLAYAATSGLEEKVKEAREAIEALKTEGETVEVVAGKPHEEILKLAGKHDLVVMGTHGATGLAGMVGSVTLRVLRSSPVPVMTVRHIVPQSLALAVVGVDGSEASLKALEAARSLAERVVPVFIDCGEGQPPEGARVICADSVVKGLLDFAQSERADFVAVGTRGLSGLRPLIGSVASGLLGASQIPVLVVNG